MRKISGIYKITNPEGHVYIGQSTDIAKRWSVHKCRSKGDGLYASIRKYGIDLHKMEIIHELPIDCEKSILLGYEKLYVDQYKSCGISMLNIVEGGVIGAATNKGKVFNEQWRSNISNAQKLSFQSGVQCNKGANHSQSILTDEQVREIRAKYVPRKYTVTMLSEEYGVCRSNIHAIIKRKNWPHI